MASLITQLKHTSNKTTVYRDIRPEVMILENHENLQLGTLQYCTMNLNLKV